MNNKTFKPGLVFAAASTVLSVVCAVLYRSSYIKISTTYTLLICAAVAGVAGLALAIMRGSEISNLILGAHAVLLMAAIGMSIGPMVNEIGLVYAGLNPKTNLTGFMTFAIAACITWLISVVASFMGMTKKEA